MLHPRLGARQQLQCHSFNQNFPNLCIIRRTENTPLIAAGWDSHWIDQKKKNRFEMRRSIGHEESLLLGKHEWQQCNGTQNSFSFAMMAMQNSFSFTELAMLDNLGLALCRSHFKVCAWKGMRHKESKHSFQAKCDELARA